MTTKRFNWRRLRIVTQVLAFIATAVYFLAIVYPLDSLWRPDLLFQLNPLTHIYILLAEGNIPHPAFFALSVIMLFAVSRIFCGWICPLGSILDFVSGIRTRLKMWSGHNPLLDALKSKLADNPHRLRLPAHFDVYLLLFLLVLAVHGSPLIWFFDPIVYVFKLLTVSLLPVVDDPLRIAYNGLDSTFYLQEWWPPVQQVYNTYFSVTKPPVFTDTVLIMLIGAVIIGFEFVQHRFWCRYICPLGATCRLTYKLHPLRRRIKQDCSHCLNCEAVCHFGATSEDDCIYCMDCIDSCKQGSVTFLPAKDALSARGRKLNKEARLPADPRIPGLPDTPAKALMREHIKGELAPSSPSRRLMLQYMAGGALAYPLVRLFDRSKELPVDFIRPPGVKNEQQFTDLCIKCGQCLKVCLTNGLQPALLEAGLPGLWTPHLISRLGYCEFSCNLCGKVCPTQAIPNLPLQEKQQFVMGMAFFLKDRCIPYDTGVNCSVCEEHCPTPDKAIKYSSKLRVDENGNPFESIRPFVVPELCIGCGICENVCPVPGEAAIRVLQLPPGAAYGRKQEVEGAQSPYPELENGADEYGYPLDG